MKKEVNIIDGKVIYNNKEYCFHYDDNLITLYPEKLEDKWKSFREMFFDVKSKEDDKTVNLYGENSNGNPIAFIKLNLKNVGRGIYRSFVPAYILGKCNAISPLPEINNFKRMTIKGECIDALYSPRKLVKELGTTKKFKPVIKFNDMKDVRTRIKINEDDWNFGVSWIMPRKDKNTIIDLSSELLIDFKDLKNVDEIIEYYISIEKIFCFLNNRKHVIFSEIKLYTNIKFYDDISKKVRNDSITFLLNINERKDIEYDLPDNHKQISILDLENYMEAIYNAINENPFIDESLPNNTYDSNHVSVEDFIRTTSAFESEFDRTYPNYKANKNANYKRVKNKILKYIEDCKIDENNRTIGYIDDFYNCIDNLEGTLPEQICCALKEFTKPLEKIKQRLFVHYNITNVNNGELAQHFAKKRNYVAHGRELQQFTDIEIVSYILVERLIYCLLLKRVGFSIDEITMILEKIFE